MPELPEVETIRRQLDTRLPGRVVVNAGAHSSAKFEQATRAVGSHFTTVRRRGKYLLIATTDQQELVVHLGMTGALSFAPAKAPTDPPPRWQRAWWRLDDGQILSYDDQRRFGRIVMVDVGCYDSLPTLSAMGPEPLSADFTPERFHALLSLSRQRVKTRLLSQRAVAGVGNIYADEALWRSGINPVARKISPARAARLHAALIAVLTEAITHGGTRLRNYRSVEGDTGMNQWHLDVYGRSGADCRRCGAMLRRRVVDGRGTTWCPRCQAR